MKTTNKYFNHLNLLLVFFLFTFGVTAATAKPKDVTAAAKAVLSLDETYSIAARGLTRKMETDLVLSGIKVKFVKVERYSISKSQIGIRGAGACQLGAEDNALPIHFDVRINVNNRAVADVAYNFVDAEEEETATGESNTLSENETFVTRRLMEKIKADFKTENIVVAIDFLNDENTADGAKAFTGGGEVRLGDMVWKKISFEIVAEGANRTNATVKYKIQ
ncbi:MAG: hypothetical protein M3384_08250 [Acidobacteriota bacterium]|nr:hypothetical protein [Acidobacteriota bacterium]